MAEAILRGLLATKAYKPGEIVVSDASSARLTTLSKGYGVATVPSNRQAAEAASAVVIAVKPGQVAGVLAECADTLHGKLVISIAAGVSLTSLADCAPGARIVRVMPNTPALVGQGMSVLCAAKGVTQKEMKTAKDIFAAVGRTEILTDEGLMDAVTGLSGSGPAFAYLFIEALADGGVAAGLSRDMAKQLAAQTLIGAGVMALESGEHTGELKDRVTSPGGTTIAGVFALETGGFRGVVMSAVKAAAKRSRELGEKK